MEKQKRNNQNLTGQIFGRLTVLEKVGRDKNGKNLWKCSCSCGNETVTQQGSLKIGHTKSCGCLYKEVVRTKPITHGDSKSATYKAWSNMKIRILNPNYEHYKHYGGRGITFDIRWNNYENFKEDMGEKPDGMTLERIDVNGNYCKENCKWATWEEQHNNKRTTRIITVGDKDLTLSELSRLTGLSTHVISDRLDKLSWDLESSISKPLREAKSFTFNGKTQTLSQWADELGTTHDNLKNRLLHGWTIEETLGTPIQKPKLYEFKGEILTLTDWAIKLGVPRDLLKRRLLDGWSLERTLSEKPKHMKRAK